MGADGSRISQDISRIGQNLAGYVTPTFDSNAGFPAGKLRGFRASRGAWKGSQPADRNVGVTERVGRSLSGFLWRKHYRGYVQEALREGYGESPWEGLIGRVVLGGKDFIAALKRKARGTRAQQRTEKALAGRTDFASIISVVEKLQGQKWSEFCERHGDWGRDLALYLGRRHGGLTLRQLAEATGCASAVGVSVAIKRFGQRLQNDARLRRLSERARAELNC